MKSILFVLIAICSLSLSLAQKRRDYERRNHFGDRPEYREHYDGYDFDDDDHYGFGNPHRNRKQPETSCPKDLKSEQFCIAIPSGRYENKGDRDASDFAWNLFKASNTQNNFALSPLSPQILLTYLAWVANGTTKEEMVNADVFADPKNMERIIDALTQEKEGFKREILISTAFFVAKDMKMNEAFSKKASQNGKADIVPVDFANAENARQTVTKWATEKTKGGLELKNLNFSPATKMVLTSAIYFKASWVYSFFPATKGVFNAPSGEEKEVDMMKMIRKFHWGEIGDYAQWAAMPYKSDDFLVIILPNANTTLDDTITKIDTQTLNNVLRELDNDDQMANLTITLPKFKIDSTSNLVAPLKKLGIQKLFSSQSQLPYLSNEESVQVTDAQQQTSIEVNEEGTVLISFTVAKVVGLSIQRRYPNKVFTVDRPFLAMIANKNNAVPFLIAKVTDPKY